MRQQEPKGQYICASDKWNRCMAATGWCEWLMFLSFLVRDTGL